MMRATAVQVEFQIAFQPEGLAGANDDAPVKEGLIAGRQRIDEHDGQKPPVNRRVTRAEPAQLRDGDSRNGYYYMFSAENDLVFLRFSW
jgi:hypothetical protein